MLDRWSKIATIALAVVLIVSAIIAPSVGGVIWLARLNYDVERLQLDIDQVRSDVDQVRSDMDQVRSDVREIQESQRAILEILERLENDLAGHTHDANGQAQFYRDGLNQPDDQRGR